MIHSNGSLIMRPAPAAVILMLVMLCGCGQRGSLYLRDKPPPGVRAGTEPYRATPYPDEATPEADTQRRRN